MPYFEENDCLMSTSILVNSNEAKVPIFMSSEHDLMLNNLSIQGLLGIQIKCPEIIYKINKRLNQTNIFPENFA